MPVAVEHASHLDGLGQAEATLDPVVHVELGGHGHAGPDRRADGLGHATSEAGPVLERTTPGVAAAVELGTQEARDQVVVTHVDLEAVDARLGRQCRAGGELGDDALEVGHARLGQAGPHGAEARGGRQRRRAVGPGVGHRAGVAKLGTELGSLGVDGIGQAGQAVTGLLLEHDAVPIGAAVGRHGEVGHRGHGHAAGGHGPMEVDEVVGHLAAWGAPFEGGGLDEPVPKRQRPQGARLEQLHGYPLRRPPGIFADATGWRGGS